MLPCDNLVFWSRECSKLRDIPAFSRRGYDNGWLKLLALIALLVVRWHD